MCTSPCGKTGSCTPGLRPRLALALALAAVALNGPGRAAEEWGIVNPSVPWTQGSYGFASDGACYGMAYVAREFQRLGLGDKLSLLALTTPRSASGGGRDSEASRRLFIEQFAGLAQNYVCRNRDLKSEVYSLPSDPQQVDESLRAAKPTWQNPQIMVLTNEDAFPPGSPGYRSHAVRIEGRQEEGNLVRYTVLDPNHPGESRTLVYDKARGSFQGYEGYGTVRHDTSELPPQNRAWLDAAIRGLAHGDPDKYLPVWRGDQDLPLTEEQYLQQRHGRPGKDVAVPPVPTDSLDRKVSLLHSDNVGGVRLYFDPLVVTEQTPAPVRWELLRRVNAQMTAGRDNLLVPVPDQPNLQAVRLGAVLREAKTGGSATVGDLTRLTGFTRNLRTGEIFLLGLREAGGRPLPLDVLTVALRLIWQQGCAPALSLDPDPQGFYGSQHARLEQIPAELRATEFVRIMLEADYAMKRLMLGEDRLGLAGFQSHFELLSQNREKITAEYVRFWLYPRLTTGAEVYAAQAGDLETCTYDSDVAVLTETMKLAQNLLVGAGTQDPLAERAAALFTQFYPQIEAARPAFRDLHGLFDAAKLAAVLRARQVQSPELEQAAARAVATVPVAETYPGIGPKPLAGRAGAASVLYVGGGVHSKPQVTPSDMVPVEGLVDAADQVKLEASGGDRATVRLHLPEAVPLDPTQAQHLDGELETSTALGELLAGNIEAALARLDAVLAADPSPRRARALRAFGRMAAGDPAAALRDADLAVPADDSLRALRGEIRLRAGDVAGALADVRAAAATYPDDRDMLTEKAWVEVHAGRWEEARADLARLAAMDPLNPTVASLRQDLRLFQRLPADRVRAYLQSRLAMPLPVGMILTAALETQSSGDPKAALRLAETALPLAQQFHEQEGGALYLEERCWALLVVLHTAVGGEQHVAAAHDYLDRFAARHPDWPSPLLWRISYDPTLSVAEALRLYSRAAAGDAAADPILLEAEVRQGLDLRAQFGLDLLLRAMGELDKTPAPDLEDLAKLVATVRAAATPGLLDQFLAAFGKAVALMDPGHPGHLLGDADRAQLRQDVARALFSPPPEPSHPAALELRALEELYLPLLASAAEYGEKDLPPGGLDRVFGSFVAAVNSDWASLPTLEQAAQLSLHFHAAYARALAKRVLRHPDFPTFARMRERGKLGTDQAVAALNRVVDGVVDQVGALPAFSRALLRLELAMQYTELLDWPPRGEVAARSGLRTAELRGQLAAGAASLVELKAGALWFKQQSTTLPAGTTAPATAAKALAEAHLQSTRLDLRFAARAAAEP